jgi:hypothetical protein
MRIRDGKNLNPGWKKFESGMEKFGCDKHPGSTTQVFMLLMFRSKGEKRLLSSSSQEDDEQDKRRKVTGTH